MTDDTEFTHERGWRFPADIDVPEEGWFRYRAGKGHVEGLSWQAYAYMARQRGLESMRSELIEDGVSEDIRHATVKVTLEFPDETIESFGAVDETLNQVNSVGYVTSVAESRAIKRAVIKALGIVPEKGEPDDEAGSADAQNPADVDPEDVDVDVDPERQSVTTTVDEEFEGDDLEDEW